jgi:prepilin-type N-terminal cleavage/methylation domain-containing protein
MKKLQKGFTLIELLVVIAIIGILSSVVLVNVNNARNRGRAASVQSSLSALRGIMELEGYTQDTNTYANPLTAGGKISQLRASLIANGETVAADTPIIGNGGVGFWFMATRTRNGNAVDPVFYCADSAGATRFLTATQGAALSNSTTQFCP